MNNLRSKYGQVALVTGASAGMGAEFARQLAEAGLDLVLVARRRSKLEEIAEELQAKFDTRVEIVELDLLDDGAIDELTMRTEELDIGLLVLAAGVFTAGPFTTNELSAETEVVTLNAIRPMQLTHRYSSMFVERGRGGIILVASTVGHQAAPYLANYAATKAYIATLGQALSYELKRSGVDLTVLSPGPTNTEGVQTAEGIDFSKLPLPMMKPDAVVSKALKGLGRRALVVPGPTNKIMDVMAKYFSPRPVLTRMFGLLLSRSLDRDPNTSRNPVGPTAGNP
ncbi:MAG TPA: SDR family NAD(P)-dependent oxidoreductase [Solirubrobacteraceae bacterium]|jgi:hypothetical protein